MNIYKKFALLYKRGDYSLYSERMAEQLPTVLKRFDAKLQEILDLACGEGSFAVVMAKNGFKVTGIDLSYEMLKFATEKARRNNVNVEFLHQDMRSISFEERFNLVTCWFDSLNYLLELKELERTFRGVCRALKRNGLFIFDMNTIHGLSVNWQRYPCAVEQDTPQLFEIHRPSYDSMEKIATLRITGFVKEPEGWLRIDEVHKERGYSLEEIRQCLMKAGLDELACFGNIQEMSEPKQDSGRVWFVAQK